jgi:hypothetical protein
MVIIVIPQFRYGNPMKWHVHTPISQLGKPTFPIFDNPIWVWLTSQEFSGVFGSFSSGVSHIKKSSLSAVFNPPCWLIFPWGWWSSLNWESTAHQAGFLTDWWRRLNFAHLSTYIILYIYIVQFFLIFFSLSLYESVYICMYCHYV